jgi:hypothetical protein
MRQSDLGRVALFTFAAVALLVASNSSTPVIENVDEMDRTLLAAGQACNSNLQCTSGFRVDAHDADLQPGRHLRRVQRRPRPCARSVLRAIRPGLQTLGQ